MNRDYTVDFETAMTLYRKREQESKISTGSPELDRLIGGLNPGYFYLFYSEDKEFLDHFLQQLIYQTIRPQRSETTEAIYVICGNYRRSRTMIDSEYLLSLMIEDQIDPEYTLERIHIICAFSEKQLMRIPELIEDILKTRENVELIALQQITKIFYGKQAVRREDPWNFARVISRIKEICLENRIILVTTSCPRSKSGNTPLPEGGSFLMHAASYITYIRVAGKISAHLVKNPYSQLKGTVISFENTEAITWEG